jgi:hypothetical protein
MNATTLTTETGQKLVWDTKYNKMVDPAKCVAYQQDIRAEILEALKVDAAEGNYDNARYCLDELITTDAEIARYQAMLAA